MVDEVLPRYRTSPRASSMSARRGGRVVECTGLENRRAARYRGFESHPLRNKFGQARSAPAWGRRRAELARASVPAAPPSPEAISPGGAAPAAPQPRVRRWSGIAPPYSTPTAPCPARRSNTPPYYTWQAPGPAQTWNSGPTFHSARRHLRFPSGVAPNREPGAGARGIPARQCRPWQRRPRPRGPSLRIARPPAAPAAPAARRSSGIAPPYSTPTGPCLAPKSNRPPYYTWQAPGPAQSWNSGPIFHCAAPASLRSPTGWHYGPFDPTKRPGRTVAGTFAPCADPSGALTIDSSTWPAGVYILRAAHRPDQTRMLTVVR